MPHSFLNPFFGLIFSSERLKRPESIKMAEGSRCFPPRGEVVHTDFNADGPLFLESLNSPAQGTLPV